MIVFECEFECFIILMCLQLHFYSKRRDIISNQTSKTSAVSTEHQKKETFFPFIVFFFHISCDDKWKQSFFPLRKKSLEINWMIVCNQRMNRQHACPNVLCKCNDFPFASSFQWVFYECQPCIRFVGSTQSNIPFDSLYR